MEEENDEGDEHVYKDEDEEEEVADQEEEEEEEEQAEEEEEQQEQQVDDEKVQSDEVEKIEDQNQVDTETTTQENIEEKAAEEEEKPVLDELDKLFDLANPPPDAAEQEKKAETNTEQNNEEVEKIFNIDKKDDEVIELPGPDSPLKGKSFYALYDNETIEFLKKWGIDLRGLQCERHPTNASRIQCFQEDEQGRDLCPDYVDPVFLTKAPDQWSCSTEQRTVNYCVARCQENNPVVQWIGHEINWCSSNPGSCAPKPPVIPLEEFEVIPWSEPPRKPLVCVAPDYRPLENISVLMLAHKEVPTLLTTLKTYADRGFLQATSEFLLYLNGRTQEMDDALAIYTQPPYSIRIMGDQRNFGILKAIEMMMANASKDFVLFLEKDFQLIESLECVEDQLDAGLRLVTAKEDPVRVVKYRSRRRPGRPNWAAKMFIGDEDAVFRRQPNLLCNHYHWIEEPDKRWSDQFWRCLGDDPFPQNKHPKPDLKVLNQTEALGRGRKGNSVFYCARSKYCNWTNNPFLLDRRWWFEAYVNGIFKKHNSQDPYKDIESYMNWQSGAWAEHMWPIAFGDGLFKHVDLNNFGQ
eukprot:TRINITY_DN2943_c0_g1_i2.p1 TRINITY_DN2943_c0_g1~~TRINITY_DN2943_c0_g1_i2.p1  ORF type:complete len:580 (-),score=176.15 TRINITY_DN2943_c0_g1_i2:58-1797(-)